jgi:hypothetical protein
MIGPARQTLAEVPLAELAFMPMKLLTYLAIALFSLHCTAAEPDVIVYGSTPGGFCAAIAAAREGVSVVLLEPTDHVGGVNTGGLSFSDSNQTVRLPAGLEFGFAKLFASTNAPIENAPFQAIRGWFFHYYYIFKD